MYCKRTHTLNLFTRKSLWFTFLFYFSFAIFAFIYGMSVIYQDGVTIETIKHSGGLLFLATLLGVVSFVSHIDHNCVCHAKHLKLIERYGDAYLKILKTELEQTTLLGHLREQWETFEKIMKEQEKLNPDIVIKRHD